MIKDARCVSRASPSIFHHQSSIFSRMTSFAVPIAADRPLLSRVAHSLYWMSRYVERAEHIARVLKINTNLLMDVGDLAPEILDRQWQSVMQTPSLPHEPQGDAPLGQRVTWSLAFDPLNLNSLVSCIGS